MAVHGSSNYTKLMNERYLREDDCMRENAEYTFIGIGSTKYQVADWKGFDSTSMNRHIR